MEPLPPMPPPQTPSSEGRWYHGIGFVLLMLFVVLGPLAFPLLWKSPRFSLVMKVLLTVVVTVITGWILVASIEYVQRIICDLQAIPRF